MSFGVNDVFVGSGPGHSVGLVPDPGPVAGTSRYLCEDGTWVSISALIIGGVALQAATPGIAQVGNANITGTMIATTFIGNLTGNASTSSDGLTSATGTAPLTLGLAAKALTGSVATMSGDLGAGGTSGVVPAQAVGDGAKFLRGDATWQTISTTTLGAVPTSRTISTTAPLTGGGDLSANRTFAVSDMSGDLGAGGTRGTAPAQAPGDAVKFLRGDATWSTPTAAQVSYSQASALGMLATSGATTVQTALDDIDNIMYTSAEPHGLEMTSYKTPVETTISYDAGTRTFSIAPKAPNTDFRVYVKGKRYTFAVAQTVSHAATEGLWFFYFDGSGVLTASQTPWTLRTYCPVALIYWDNSNLTNITFAEERHGLTMDSTTHEYLHKTIGTRYETGLAIGDYTLASAGNITASFTDGVIHDEDIEVSITHAAAPGTNQFEQVLRTANKALVPIYYRFGVNGDWRKKAASASGYLVDGPGGNNRHYYNQLTGGAWQETEVGLNDFSAVWIFATDNISEPVIAILGQRTDTSLTNAKSNNTYEALSFGALPFAEFKILYRLIFRSVGGGAAWPGKVSIEDIQDLRSVSNVPAGTYVATAHSALTGLDYASANHTGFVELQAGTPGTAQTGNINVSGTIISGLFSGPLTGNVTGNADTATLAATVTVVDSSSATCWPAIFDAATGSLAAKTDAGLTYNATTAALSATTFVGALTGNATTSSDGLTSATGTAPLTLNLAAKALTGSVAVMSGDLGAGGTAGTVPAQAIGDATKFLRGDATWQAISGATGTGATDRVTFWSGVSTLTYDNDFVWDNTNKFFGIGIVPTSQLHVHGAYVALSPTGTQVFLETLATEDSTPDACGVYSWLESTNVSGSTGTMTGFRSTFVGSGNGGSTPDFYSFYSSGTVGVGHTLVDRWGLFVDELTGAGTVSGTQYGVYVASLTKGGTGNYSIYTGAAPSFFGGNITISNTAPSLTLTDTTAAAKSLNVLVDANVASLYESAGAAGDILSLDLANKRVGVGTAAPSAHFHLSAASPELRTTWTTTSNLGAHYFYESATLKGGMQQIGSTFATAARQNNLEFFTTGTGKIAFAPGNTGDKVTFDTSGNVGIGVTPSYALHVQKAIAATGAANTMVECLSNATTADANSRTAISGNSWATNSSGAVGFLVGFNGNVYAATSGGTATSASSVSASGAVNTGATIGTRYGLQVLDTTGAGTLTTQYGVHIANLTKGATNYSVYTGTAASYFGGNVGVQAIPGAAFDVAGKFQVDTNGDIVKLKNVTTSFPAANSAGVLSNDGAGNLTWGVAGTGSGTLRVLKETVFAGIATTSYSTATTYTIDGSDYLCTVAGNGASDMVATGLRLRRGTTSGAGTTNMKIVAGNTGDFASIVGESRMRRGQWAFWVRMASHDFTNTASGNSWAGGVVSNYPKWGFTARSRARNINGCPNTSTGGIAFDHWIGGSDLNPSSYPGVSTADVLCVFVKGNNQLDVYYGTYSAGWPTMETMTLMGRVQNLAGGSTFWLGSATSNPIASVMDIAFEFGGAAGTSAGTAEIIFDRWRITSWD